MPNLVERYLSTISASHFFFVSQNVAFLIFYDFFFRFY